MSSHMNSPVENLNAPAHYLTVFASFAHLLHVDSEEVAKVEDKTDEAPFTAVPSDLLLDSHPSSPAGGTRCSTPTFSLVGRPVAVNPALKELTLELLKVWK